MPPRWHRGRRGKGRKIRKVRDQPKALKTPIVAEEAISGRIV